MAQVGRRAVAGALLGAVIGFVAGWLIHTVTRDGGSAFGYELTGAFLGLIAGVALGAFYGGATSVARARGGRGPS